MQIYVNTNIEPIPVKEFGDPLAETKYRKTKTVGKNGSTDDMYNFYGDYDLTKYFEDTSNVDAATQKKNLCLCVSYKK